MIPSEYLEKYNRLRPIRQLIIQEFFRAKENERGSFTRLVNVVARKLHYTIDKNNSNRHIAKVIRQFL